MGLMACSQTAVQAGHMNAALQVLLEDWLAAANRPAVGSAVRQMEQGWQLRLIADVPGLTLQTG